VSSNSLKQHKAFGKCKAAPKQTA